MNERKVEERTVGDRKVEERKKECKKRRKKGEKERERGSWIKGEIWMRLYLVEIYEDGVRS